jgi:hypothetical protein
MANLPTRSLSAIVQSFAAGVQGRAAALIDFSVGSTLRAIAEATGGVSLWLQSVALRILLTTRAATSTGADLDSFVNDFGVTRLGATYASGPVTFTRLTASATVVMIPVGTQVRTADDSQIFVVTADPTNGSYSAGSNGYALASMVGSVTVPVSALTAGTGGNVAVGAITQVLSTIPGIDTVSNASAFTNAADGENDAALRIRFRAFIAQLSKATRSAVAFAISSLGTNLQYTITENYTLAGVYFPGSFYVVVDDGSGAPPASTISAAQSAVDAVRALGISIAVYRPVVISANVAMSITTAPGYTHSDVIALVVNALTQNINTLGLGNSLPYTQLMRWAYQASPGVTNVTGVTLNGGTADLTATSNQTIKLNNLIIS